MLPIEMSIELLPTKISLSEFVSVLENYDSYFQPNLSELNNLKQWAEKVYNNAIVDCFKNENKQVIGLTAYYCNDVEHFEAYLTLIFVDKQFQGGGIAESLFKQVLQSCKLKGMRTLKLECGNENHQANKFYVKMGGHLYSQNDSAGFYSFLVI